MHQPIRILFINALLFVVLLQLGATLQTWSVWQGFVATGISMLPAFVFAWFHLPDRESPDRFPADEAIILYLTMLVVGYLGVDILQIPVDSSPASWLMFLIGCVPILFYKFGKSQLSRSQSAVANQSKS